MTCKHWDCPSVENVQVRKTFHELHSPPDCPTKWPIHFTCLFKGTSQLTFTCSKSMLETLLIVHLKQLNVSWVTTEPYSYLIKNVWLLYNPSPYIGMASNLEQYNRFLMFIVLRFQSFKLFIFYHGNLHCCWMLLFCNWNISPGSQLSHKTSVITHWLFPFFSFF